MSEERPAAMQDPGRDSRSAAGIPVVPSLDGLRGAAVLGVIAFHVVGAAGVTGQVLDSAAGQVIFGVLPQFLNLLFMVSGFVMFLPAAARSGDLGAVRAYALRRAARLVPAYWMALIITLLTLLVIDLTRPELGVAMPSISTVLAHFSFIHVPYATIVGEPTVGFAVNGPVWTLSVEATFYVLLPIVALAFFRRPVLGVTAAAVVWWIWAVGFKDVLAWENQFPFWILSFALGMGVARAYVVLLRRDSPRTETRALWATLATMAVLAYLAHLAGVYSFDQQPVLPFSFTKTEPWLQFAITVLLGAWMLAMILSPRWLQAPLSNRPTRWLGDISYGAYVIHFLVMFPAGIYFAMPTDGTWGAALVWTAAVLPVSIVYGWASRRFLELPVRRRARVVARRISSAHSPASA